MSTLREAAEPDWLDEEPFYNAMQRYRCAPREDQREVVACFEAVKRLVRAELAKPDARPAPAEPQPIAAWSIVRTAESAVVTAVRAALSAAPAPQPAGGEPQPAAQQSKPLLEWQKAVMEAYGHLWHVNNEPAAPIPMRSPEKAAYEARKCLRELLTKEERGEAINAVGQLIGRGITATKGDSHD